MGKVVRWVSVITIGLVSVLITNAQIQIGTVRGTVTDSTGALLPGARVVLTNSVTGYHRETTTDGNGEFLFNNVPFDPYTLHAELRQFQTVQRAVTVRTNLPVVAHIPLPVAGMRQVVTVEATTLLEEDSPSTETGLDETFIQRLPGATLGDGLRRAIATTAGWIAEDNGLLHARGVDDGFLFVTDGIPLSDRIDTWFGGSMDTEMIRSMNIIVGHIPPEYGYAVATDLVGCYGDEHGMVSPVVSSAIASQRRGHPSVSQSVTSTCPPGTPVQSNTHV